MARKLRFFNDQMSKAGITRSSTALAQADIHLDDLEARLGELEAELIEVNAARQREISSDQPAESLATPLLKDDESIHDLSKQVRLGFLTGLVPKEKAMAFERIIFRATRGNVLLRQAALEEAVVDPTSGQKVQKNIFVAFFSGERVKSKIVKISEAFGVNRYPFTEDMGKQAQMVYEVYGRLSELKMTIEAGLQHRATLLQRIGKQYEEWNEMVRIAVFSQHHVDGLDLTSNPLLYMMRCFPEIEALKTQV